MHEVLKSTGVRLAVQCSFSKQQKLWVDQEIDQSEQVYLRVCLDEGGNCHVIEYTEDR